MQSMLSLTLLPFMCSCHYVKRACLKNQHEKTVEAIVYKYIATLHELIQPIRQFASLESRQPTYTAATMHLFQHTRGKEGLTQFTYNYVLLDQSDSTTQICASSNAYLLCAEGQAQRFIVGMG